MSVWSTVQLHEVAELTGGHAFKSSEYSEQGMFILRTLNISDDCSIDQENAKFIPHSLVEQYRRFELEQNDTLFVMVGATLGKVGFVRENTLPALLNQNMWRVRARNGRIDPIYLHYCFRHFSKGPLEWMSGSARGFVRRDDYRKLEIPLPNHKEQREIAAVLGALDDKIELNRKTAATLEAMARALFRSWFVDFDPVTAKSEGRAPAHMPPTTTALFPDSFGEDGLPEGWEKKRIGEVINRLKAGKLFNQKSVAAKGNVPVLDQGKQGVIGYHDEEPNIVAAPNRRVSVFANHTCVQKLMQEPFSTIQNVISFVGKELPTEYCHFASLGKQSFEEYRGHWPSFVEAECVIPERELALAFADTVSPWLDLIFQSTTENQTLATLRDTLLPRLMSGELRVGEARDEVEAATSP